MKNNKKNVTTQIEKPTPDLSSDDGSRLELKVILNHMKTKGPIHTYKAAELYGIRDCRTPISRINELIPVADKWVMEPHPTTGILTRIKLYWLEAHVIEALDSVDQADELARQQESAKIAKHRASNIKALQEMCSYSKRETIDKRLDEIYGKIAANDD